MPGKNPENGEDIMAASWAGSMFIKSLLDPRNTSDVKETYYILHNLNLSKYTLVINNEKIF
jgi:hypothetical protein